MIAPILRRRRLAVVDGVTVVLGIHNSTKRVCNTSVHRRCAEVRAIRELGQRREFCCWDLETEP